MLYTILMIAIVLILIFGIIGTYKSFGPIKRTITEQIYPACQPPFSNLVDVTGSKLCPNGNLYVSSLGMIVSSVPSPYLNACFTACTVQLDNGCLDPTENKIFQRCVQLSQPLGCNSLSNPVGYSGTSYYYVSDIGIC